MEAQRIELDRTLASSKEKEQSYTLTKKEATRKAAALSGSRVSAR